jgi:galactokinase/mevalonate kinase-like predicted kinase
MVIRSKALLRLSFAGGGTDVRPFVDIEGGCVPNATIARYAWGSLAGLRRQKQLAFDMKNALLERRLDDFGELLGAAWHYKKKMSPKISTPLVDEMYEQAARHGAIGGKITGAGGGYMLFYCRYEKKLRVAEALRKMGATPTGFGFDLRGLQTWRVNEARRSGESTGDARESRVWSTIASEH